MSEAQSGPAVPRPAERPTSPFVSVWRWHVTMACSILHRVTGVVLYGAALILAGWAAALATGPGAYDGLRLALGSPLGKLVLIAITFSLFYHLANGIRHLSWDFGTGFLPRIADLTAYLALAFAAVATIGVWALAGMTGALA